MDQGEKNVIARLEYRWHELYGQGQAPVEGMLEDWRLAKRQGAKWLSEDIERTIMAWHKPK